MRLAANRYESRFAPGVFTVLLLAGCATATDAEKRTALNTWHDCVASTVARLDDGKSDAATVAYGVAPACAEFYRVFTEAMISGMITEGGQAFMRDKARSEELRMITAEVLRQRAARR
jgi:hypothetical protein